MHGGQQSAGTDAQVQRRIKEKGYHDSLGNRSAQAEVQMFNAQRQLACCTLIEARQLVYPSAPSFILLCAVLS